MKEIEEVVDPYEHTEFYEEHVELHMTIADEWIELQAGSFE